MPIEKLLTERRSQFLTKWLASAGHGGKEHMLSGSRGWANPLPMILEEAYAEAYDSLCGPSPAAGPALIRLMRLRALDGPEVALALACFSTLRTLVRDEIAPLLADPTALTGVEARIDALAAEASRHFADSRQLLVELRQREPILRTAKLVERLQRRPAVERTGP